MFASYQLLWSTDSQEIKLVNLVQKCTKCDLCWGSAPHPTGETYSTPPDPVAVFEGPTSKERGKEVGEQGKGKKKGKGWGREEEGKEKEGREKMGGKGR